MMFSMFHNTRVEIIKEQLLDRDWKVVNPNTLAHPVQKVYFIHYSEYKNGECSTAGQFRFVPLNRQQTTNTVLFPYMTPIIDCVNIVHNGIEDAAQADF